MAATTASSCPPAGPDLPPTVNGTTSCASSSSSKKSLFDRVANFRRSLIKSEQKKNKIRPTSGSFNFFKPTSSSNLTENGAPTNGAKTVSPNGVCEYSGSTVEGTTVPNGQSQAAQAAHLGSASNLRHSIIVDEEDAIYGFTSLHLNNPTSLRRQLKSQQQAQQSQQSSSESNGRCSIRRTSTSSSSPSQLFTSSSCISLYETIDEVEQPINGAAGGPVSSFSSSGDSSMDSSSKGTLAPAPPPLPPSNGKVHHHFTSKHRHSGHSSVSSRQLRLHSVPGEIDWRHRRSSAIIFSNDLHDLCLEDGGEEQPTSLQMGAPGYGPVINGHHQHHLNGGHPHRTGGDLASSTTTSAGQAHSMTCRLSGASHHSLHLHSSLNRSSDDLLLGRSAYFNHHPSMGHQHEIATDGSDQQSLPKPYVNGHCNGRIYENLLNGSLVNGNGNGGNYQQHQQHSQSQHSHPKRSDNRKLTKDSGYESASTLVSLTGQLNGGSGGAPMPSSPNGGAGGAGLPPVQVASLSRTSFNAAGTHILMISPPPPPNAVHCRSDSLDSANSLCGDLQSPSPPLPNKCSQADSPPLPSPPSGMDSYDDCRPPTPPVRYSSLPQNRSFLHSGQSRPMPPPPPPTIPSGGGGLPPSHADLRSLLNRSMPSLWHQQMQSSFDSFDSHQVGRLSSAQLLTLIQQSGLPAFPPPPPPLPPPNSSEPVLEYHHVRQDSCPSALPSTHPNGYPSMVSLSPGDPTQRRHTSKSVPLSSSSSTCDSAAGTLTSRYTRSAQTQAYSAKPYTVYNGASPTPDHRGSGFHLTQSPSLSSLQSNTAVPNGTSVRHSIASCSTATLSAVNGHGAHLPTGVPPTQQIVRSHRLPQVTRQELGVPAPKPHRAPLETSLDDFIGEVPGQASTSPPPPPLPPKNVSNGAFPTPKSGSTGDLRQCQLRLKTSPEQSSLTSDLKAIQKRAVYEFYLRQKEKKEKAKRSPTDSPSRRNSGSSSGSSTATLTSPISGTGEQCTSAKSQSHSEHEDDGIIEEEELPLPTPPPLPLPSNNGAVTMSSSQVNQFFAHSPLHSAPLTEEEMMTFPPPPTPVASFETPFPAPPTPLTVAPIADLSPGSALSPAFPPPPTPTTATVMSLSPVVATPPRQMFHDIDLSHLWPSVDFSRLLQPLPMPPVKESLTLGEDYDSLEDQDEELASIEANRERQEADGWRVSQLEAERCRLELEGQRNEEIIGRLVRSRLTGDLALDGNKLELLCKDMIMIIRLMVSIVQQLTTITITSSTPRPKGLQPGEKGARKVASQLSPSPLSPSSFSLVSSTTVAARVPAVSVIKTKAHSDSNGTVPTDANDVANNAPDGSEAAVGHCSDAASTTSKGPVDVLRQEEKRIRLWDQLEEARRLRDNIETRRTMLQERLTRKCAARNSSPGTTTTTTTTNQSSMLLRLLMITGAKGEQGNVANGTPNGALDGYLASQLATDRTAAADTTSRTTASAAAAAAASIGDIDLSTLIRCYLTQKEHLLVQSEVARLLLAEANSRIETPGSTVVGPVN